MTGEVNDWKINAVNETSKKITIKHYLNLYIRPYVTDEQEEKDPTKWKHAVYVRITFNRITAKIKSATNLWCTLEEFDNQTEEIAKLLERESLFLIDYVSRNYTKTNNVIVQEEFNVNELFHDFEYSLYELDKVVDRLLVKSMVQYLELDQGTLYFEVLEQAIAGDYSIGPLELLTYFELQSSSIEGFKDKFSDMLWTWKVLYQIFKLSNNQYGQLGANVLDYQNGDFKQAFRNTLNLDPDTTLLLYKDIDYLLDTYYFLGRKPYFSL